MVSIQTQALMDWISNQIKPVFWFWLNATDYSIPCQWKDGTLVQMYDYYSPTQVGLNCKMIRIVKLSDNWNVTTCNELDKLHTICVR